MRIPIDLIDAHPDNANRMTPETLAKLREHLARSGRYPPLIVRPRPRPRPRMGHRYEMLDGHHRLIVLRELGHREAECVVWEVDDEQAAELLLTLNRLHGEDDPHRRGALIARLGRSIHMDELASRLPDPRNRIDALLALHAPAHPPREPEARESMPEAVTFFLIPARRKRLLARLREVDANRSEALARLLKLDESGQEADQ
jgi:ParB-like chromosome segregation protein Spo0J